MLLCEEGGRQIHDTWLGGEPYKSRRPCLCVWDVDVDVACSMTLHSTYKYLSRYLGNLGGRQNDPVIGPPIEHEVDRDV